MLVLPGVTFAIGRSGAGFSSRETIQFGHVFLCIRRPVHHVRSQLG
jgi:hypothetical protein